ncbi:MAG: lysine--tRNA ligase [Chloroflexota bacterium]
MAKLPEDEYVAARRTKLDRLRAAGIDPFPAHFHRTHTSAAVREAFERLAASGEPVTLAGRLLLLRNMGKVQFADVVDGSGRFQLFFQKDELGDEPYELFKGTVDLGDIVGVTGTLFTTKTGEPTLRVRRWELLSKALRPLPEKWHGLTDPEARFRRRHLDLISNPGARVLLQKRSLIVREVRRFLDERGFVELETPVLQGLHGGAAAKPFATHHNALDRGLFLRISLELYLKRLLIGGFDKIYEIGRNFRNEGIDRSHNPEFTMLETYEAYADYHDVMRMTEELVSTVALRALGSTTISVQGTPIDLTPPWPRKPLRQAIRDATGIDYAAYPTLETLSEAVRVKGPRLEQQKTRAKLIDQLLDVAVGEVIQPVFFTDYPVELSPLAKLKPGEPGVVERFEAFAAGVELGNAFTELNDPDDQYERFLDQVRQAEAGDDEAHTLDLDFLEAMQHGMPPAGGLGIGIDRLAMFLLDARNVREVIAFPMLRELSG